jgi:hypothetical protein
MTFLTANRMQANRTGLASQTMRTELKSGENGVTDFGWMAE